MKKSELVKAILHFIKKTKGNVEAWEEIIKVGGIYQAAKMVVVELFIWCDNKFLVGKDKDYHVILHSYLTVMKEIGYYEFEKE